ncbi:MAG: hypothetical protein WC365_09265 [Candidatus Babeliales bacterium]|jgi:hypothetical protein
MSAQQEFAKILDDLKERYEDLLVICDGQYKQIEAANKIIAKICEQCLNEKCTEGGDCHISDLKATLEIPRKEEAKINE